MKPWLSRVKNHSLSKQNKKNTQKNKDICRNGVIFAPYL